MMNVTLGLPSDRYDEIPMKSMKAGSDRETDIELGFEIEGGSPMMRDVRNLEPAISVLQVTIRRPYTIPTLMAITWSLFPYVIPIFTVLSFIRHSAVAMSEGTSTRAGYSGFLLFYIFLALFCVLLNEKVLKRIIQEPRPAASASQSYGMPSGHSTSCYAWMVWCLVELLAHPSSSTGFTTFLIVLALFVLGPVPYARVFLHDHTGRQVLVGMAVGSVIGLLAVPIRSWLLPHSTPVWLPSP